jgi:hypothetical protein
MIKRQPTDQFVFLVSLIQEPSFSSTVRLTRSTPSFDGECLVGDPRTMLHSGHNSLTLAIIFVRLSCVSVMSLPEYSLFCLRVIAAYRNSFPLSDWSIIGGPITVKISMSAYAMQEALVNLRGILNKNFIP